MWLHKRMQHNVQPLGELKFIIYARF